MIPNFNSFGELLLYINSEALKRVKESGEKHPEVLNEK